MVVQLTQASVIETPYLSSARFDGLVGAFFEVAFHHQADEGLFPGARWRRRGQTSSCGHVLAGVGVAAIDHERVGRPAARRSFSASAMLSAS